MAAKKSSGAFSSFVVEAFKNKRMIIDYELREKYIYTVNLIKLFDLIHFGPDGLEGADESQRNQGE